MPGRVTNGEAAGMPRLGRSITTVLVLLALAGVAVAVRYLRGCSIRAAIEAGDVARVQQILARRPGLARASYDDGSSPLHLAAARDATGIVELLIEAGAPVNQRDAFSGNTPLHIAAGSAGSATIGLLLKNGADPGARNHQGDCPLHLAADRGRVEVIRCFIQAEADLGVTDSLGRTPLRRAAERGRAAAVRLLRSRAVQR